MRHRAVGTVGMSPTQTPPDAIILGCVKTKRASPAKAKDLYVSPMFAKRRRYAESSGVPWFIFSAEHGIIDPELVIAPYDVAMSRLPVERVQAKGRQAVDQLEALVGPLRGKTFEIHAGASYVRAITGPLTRRGATLSNPLGRLRFGPQLHWYDERAGVGTGHARSTPRTNAPAGGPQVRSALDASATADAQVAVNSVSELEPFDFGWPEGPEHFDRGWDYTATVGSSAFQVRHGLGGREVYGRYRIHSVTWLDGQPMVEGVAADDYAESGSLLSTLRIEGRAHVRDWSELPIGYAGFTIVRHSDEIVAKYSRDSLAVKVLQDDLAAWARHAILRAQSKAPGAAPGRAYRKAVETAPGPRVTLPPPPDLDRSAIVGALLQLAEQEKAQLNESGDPFFTPNELANRFLLENPLAFLLAVIFDQGILAERAWAAPYELSRRLGHLDPHRLADDIPAIAKAVATPPMLQRFVNTIPPWIASAARRVIGDYGGDAGRIWADGPTAEELDRRLRAFDGIGQKKAAMAVEILARDFAVPLDEMSGSDVAVDVHVRRVFLRTGLSASDSVEDIVRAARELHPLRPGELDVPVWMIGRNWCRPRSPRCSSCPISWACPSSTAYPQRADDLVSLRTPATLATRKRAPVTRVGAGEDIAANP